MSIYKALLHQFSTFLRGRTRSSMGLRGMQDFCSPHLVRRRSTYDGLYPPEHDSALNGIWVDQCLTLPVTFFGVAQVIISGTINFYNLTSNENDSVTLNIVCGNKVQARYPVDSDETIFTWTTSLRFPNSHFWYIFCSHFFIPADTVNNGDSRRLSWRVKMLSVGRHILIDCSRRCSTTLRSSHQTPLRVLIAYDSATVSGISQGGNGMLAACKSAGLHSEHLDLGATYDTPQEAGPLYSDGREFAIVHANFDNINFHMRRKQQRFERCRWRIGYWAWEQQCLPPSAFSGFQYLDEVWVPSSFAQSAVMGSSPVPVIRVPHVVEPPSDVSDARASFGFPTNRVIVLVVCDLNSGSYRKNPEGAIEAFLLANKSNSNGFLVVKLLNGDNHPSALNTIRSLLANVPNSVVLTEALSRQEMWALMSSCDVLLALHRAEGFGLCLAEMMAMGKVVIATGWSGNTDFMNSGNSCLVQYELHPLGDEKAFGLFNKNELWAEPKVENAADWLTKCYESRNFREYLGLAAATTIRDLLSSDTVGKIVRKRLEILSEFSSRDDY